MSKKITYKGQFKGFMLLPVRMFILIAIFNIAMFFVDIKAGIVMTVFSLLYLITILLFYMKYKSNVINEMVSFAAKYGQIQKQLLRDLEICYALLDDTGKIIWTNEAFEQTLHIKKGYKKAITSLIPEIDKGGLPGIESETETMISFEDKEYRISMKKVSLEEVINQSNAIDVVDYDSYLIAFFMFDETEVNALKQENDDQKVAVGLIYIDNYDEALESIEEVRRSLLEALIDRKINKYFSTMNALVKKLEKDKYLIVIEKKFLSLLEDKKFDILEDVKTVNIGNEMNVTLSIGFGVENGSYQDNYENARASIDLALGRGGDQAIVKHNEDIKYYGGKSQKAEKYTRVKARVKAHALREIIEANDKIIIMGHKILDADAFGAAVGVARASRTFGKKTHIVVNEVTASIRLLMEGMISSKECEQDLFINNYEALDALDASTVLVVVDVNKAPLTECEELLNRCSEIVVIDHHRTGKEKIENTILSYIEPYASSACEMVSEILQYIHDDVKLRPSEADCLYSGIMIDTNNFTTKTGVRTFEAAAYLRRCGADVTRVHKMFREDISSYIAKVEAVRHAEVYEQEYAVSIAPAGISETPTITAAQAANELLNINGIKASFVLTEYQGKIFISARSVDDINVQVIMEKLGGGGHMNTAGTQLENMSVDEAKDLLLNTLSDMQKEGEL